MQRGRPSLFEDLLNIATCISWWMDLMIAVFAYIGLHLWHVHFLHEMNQINNAVPAPVSKNTGAGNIPRRKYRSGSWRNRGREYCDGSVPVCRTRVVCDGQYRVGHQRTENKTREKGWSAVRRADCICNRKPALF